MKPWAFGAVVMLTCYLDFSGGSAAHDFSEWLGSVSRYSLGSRQLLMQQMRSGLMM